MKQASYSEKLKDPRWQKRRLKVLEYADWRCQLCGAKDKPLHCHHSYYARGKDPWQYPAGAIICVCETCHGRLHPNKTTRAKGAAIEARRGTFPPPIPVAESGVKSAFDQMRELLGKLP